MTDSTIMIILLLYVTISILKKKCSCTNNVLKDSLEKTDIDRTFIIDGSEISIMEDRVAQLVEHWTANLAARVRSPVEEEPSDLMCAFLHVQMESNWAGLPVRNCRHTGK